MSLVDRKYGFWPVALMLAVLASCSIPPYIPGRGDSIPKMNVQEARVLVKQQLLHDPTGQGEGMRVQSSRGSGLITNVLIQSDKLQLTTAEGATVNFPFRGMSITAQTSGWSDRAWYIWLTGGALVFKTSPTDNGRPLADALYVLARAAGRETKAETEAAANFDLVARSYREAAIKPTLPEDARRFKVQAEGAVRDRSFDEAAELYGKALQQAPWWPEGHFNRAIVLSETGDFAPAIVEMRRYLALVPDAPDARAAQDKIYDWERRARSGR